MQNCIGLILFHWFGCTVAMKPLYCTTSGASYCNCSERCRAKCVVLVYRILICYIACTNQFTAVYICDLQRVFPMPVFWTALDALCTECIVHQCCCIGCTGCTTQNGAEQQCCSAETLVMPLAGCPSWIFWSSARLQKLSAEMPTDWSQWWTAIELRKLTELN